MLDRIDWGQPWFRDLYALAAPLTAAGDLHAALDREAASRNLANLHGQALRFVPQSVLSSGVAYESFIWQTGQVPTRQNLHDFFNALAWLAFPEIKKQLNALQATEIERLSGTDLGGRRGALRDALTVFDENAAFIVLRRSPEAEAFRTALLEHRWKEAFMARRSAFQTDYDVQLFGHALLEKLVNPYKAVTAHARLVEADAGYFNRSAAARREWLDSMIACRLRDFPLAALPKTPLPVAGIPGWWPEQSGPFYDDALVFRPKRDDRGRSVPSPDGGQSKQ